MKTVIRNTENEITHIYYTTTHGRNIYVTPKALKTIYEGVNTFDIQSHFKGNKESIEDVLIELLNGEISKEYYMYLIKVNNGSFTKDEVIMLKIGE